MDDVTRNEISDGQTIAAIVLGICSASLSIIGSVTLVFKICRDWAKNGSTTPYDRMILGLSTCDIIYSTTYAIQRFLYPRGAVILVWAFGNPATCQMSGFLLQLSLSAYWYNGLLSYFFLMTVLSQVLNKNYVQTFEPWIHLTGVFFPATSILGLFLGWYHEDTIGCWIADGTIAWIVGGIPTFIMFLSIIINYTAIYAIVRKSLRLSQHIVKKEATKQMFMYVAAFVISTTPICLMVILEKSFGFSNNELYPLWVLSSITLPLQGCFNFFIYIKPAYVRFRAANQTKSMRFVLHQALFNPKTPDLFRRKEANRTTEASVYINSEEFFSPAVRRLSSSSKIDDPLSSSNHSNDTQVDNPSNELESAVFHVQQRERLSHSKKSPNV